jgi:hypothetical protein
LWGYDIDEVKIYLEFIGREILFREVVLNAFGAGKESQSGKANLHDSFCVACKVAKKDIDCANCTKTFQVAESG